MIAFYVFIATLPLALVALIGSAQLRSKGRARESFWWALAALALELIAICALGTMADLGARVQS